MSGRNGQLSVRGGSRYGTPPPFCPYGKATIWEIFYLPPSALFCCSSTFDARHSEGNVFSWIIYVALSQSFPCPTSRDLGNAESCCFTLQPITALDYISLLNH